MLWGNHVRTPSLETALAYEAIYDIPVRELFAGLYAQVEQGVAGRAKLLGFRTIGKPKPEREGTIKRLVSKLTA